MNEKAYYGLRSSIGDVWEIWTYAEGKRFYMAHRHSIEDCIAFGKRYGYEMIESICK